jgi:hypothetical protein
MADPEPDDVVAALDVERSIVKPDADRPEAIDLLEVKRWVQAQKRLLARWFMEGTA